MSRSRARVREFFRRDNLRDFLSTMALVAPLTVLVWVWAEREQAVEVPDKKPFAIAVRATNITRPVTIAPGQADTVVVEMSGPRAGVEAIKDAVAKNVALGRLVIDVPDTYDPGGPYTLVLDSILDQQKIFRDYGVTVHATDPAKLLIMVDKQVERDVPVRLPTEIADGVQTATFEPKTVKVSGPERAITELEKAGMLKAELAIANLTELRARGIPTPPLTNVPLRPIDVAGVTFDVPKIARVTLQLSEEKQDEIRSMVVYINKPAALEGHVLASVTPVVLNGVKVIGPSDALVQLREGKGPPPYAVVTITREDIGKRSEPRVPTFLNLPPGVRVVESSVPAVTFDVIESTAADDVSPIP